MAENGKKSRDSEIFTYVILIVVGAVCGYFGGRLIGAGLAASTGSRAVIFLVIFGALLLWAFVHTVLHEWGHYICAKKSGYEFVSFRLGKSMYVKTEDGVEKKHYNVEGTGGQCLMKPPAKDENGSFPYKLYNFGGVMFNLVAAAVTAAVYVIFPAVPYLSAILMTGTLVGIAYAGLNGVPMKIGGIANDGYNLRAISRDSVAKDSMWKQLMINAEQTEYSRLGEMPREWFELPEGANMANPLICAIGVFESELYNDLHDFTKARELAENMLRQPGTLELYKNELSCEILFYELMGENRPEEVEKLYTKRLKSYIKATISYPSRRRLLYALNVLGGEKGITRKLEADFERAADEFPFRGAVESEREIMELIKERAGRTEESL